MPDSSQRIWTVIPTYDRSQSAIKALSAVFAQTALPAGVILVDDCSPESIGEQARRRFGERLTVLRLAHNAGPAAGFAAGIKRAMEAGADWVWLMDDDAWPLGGALEALACRPEFSAAETAALVSLKQDAAGRLQKWEAVGHSRRLRLPDAALYLRPVFPVEAAAFAGLLVRAAVVQRAGLPDARYFSWFADYEFCLRLRRHGPILCVPGSRVVHEDDASRGTHVVRGHRRPNVPVFLKQCTGLRNRTYYFSRSPGRVSALLEAAYRFGRMAGGILLWDDRRAFRLRLLCRAFLDGLRGRLGPFLSP